MLESINQILVEIAVLAVAILITSGFVAVAWLGTERILRWFLPKRQYKIVVKIEKNKKVRK